MVTLAGMGADRTEVYRNDQAWNDHLDMQSESPELIAAILHNADSGCFIRSAVRSPTEMRIAVELNGAPLDLSEYPTRPPR